MFAGQSAFLGPNIWDNSAAGSNGEDFNLEYMDLDEFLVENCVDDKMVASTFGAGSPTAGSPQQSYSPQPRVGGGPLSLSPMHEVTSPMPHMSPVLSPPAPESPPH